MREIYQLDSLFFYQDLKLSAAGPAWLWSAGILFSGEMIGCITTLFCIRSNHLYWLE